MDRVPAILVLEDGSVFDGISIGVEGSRVGEVVFNTAMSGYQEILTDPSYAEQMVTLTSPHVGNTGINTEDYESSRAWLSALIVRDMSDSVSNWRATTDLSTFLHQHRVVAMAGLDTRALTVLLREKGALRGCMAAPGIAVDSALAMARDYPGLMNRNLACEVSTTRTYTWDAPGWDRMVQPEILCHVVVYDFGVKRNNLRFLVDSACRVTVVPALTPPAEVLSMRPDGIFLSNGPGDPAACTEIIANIRTLLREKIPLFGVCLGHQLLALAAGGRTVKKKFGHHGTNHPVMDIEPEKVIITSQNHGFSVDEASLPPSVRVTHRSLFDATVQGLRFLDTPAFGFQGHPEASPGPHDGAYLFASFLASMRGASETLAVV